MKVRFNTEFFSHDASQRKMGSEKNCPLASVGSNPIIISWLGCGKSATSTSFTAGLNWRFTRGNFCMRQMWFRADFLIFFHSKIHKAAECLANNTTLTHIRQLCVSIRKSILLCVCIEHNSFKNVLINYEGVPFFKLCGWLWVIDEYTTY